MTGPQLAKRLGVSAQTVSEWERGKYLPEAAKLSPIAKVLQITVDWLLTGRNHGALGGNISAGGRLVSKIPYDELPSFDPRNLGVAAVSRERVYTHFPCGEFSFQITVPDAANTPHYLPGDSVIIDPDRKPMPGDMVLVVTSTQALLRRFRPKGEKVELLPWNELWQVETVKLGDDARLLGVLSEHARPPR